MQMSRQILAANRFAPHAGQMTEGSRLQKRSAWWLTEGKPVELRASPENRPYVSVTTPLPGSAFSGATRLFTKVPPAKMINDIICASISL
jgi:hypothetical protein